MIKTDSGVIEIVGERGELAADFVGIMFSLGRTIAKEDGEDAAIAFLTAALETACECDCGGMYEHDNLVISAALLMAANEVGKSVSLSEIAVPVDASNTNSSSLDKLVSKVTHGR